MNTVAEIERAIAQLPPEQWVELRGWMDRHAPGATSDRAGDEPAKFDEWLAASTGLAKGRFTTEERMRETRGED